MIKTQIFTLLIVDDDPLIHQSLKITLPDHWKIYSAFSEESIQFERFYHAAFVDMHLDPPGSQKQVATGPKIIERLLQNNNQLEVIAMSGDLRRDLMEASLKAGAQRFLAKPLLPEETLLVTEKIEAFWNLRALNSSADRRATRWIGSSPLSEKTKKSLASLKGETSTVLLEGETGVGKEVAAKILHEQENPRPFVAVNLASIPEHLFESEFFGHLKGAFTGADANKIGLAEAANGGDLFLDEVEALPLSQQAKLLRFLETGEVRKVGAKESFLVKTRVIVATNRNLDDMVRAGEFRQDLLYRICAHKIMLPSLRVRLEDIPELSSYFIESERPRRNKQFTEDAIAILKTYSWPGNVRELKRVCEQLSLTSPLPIIREEDVKQLLFPGTASRMSSVDKGTGNSAAEESGIDFHQGLNTLVSGFEALVIGQCLKQTKDIELAAKLLKISRSNLYKKLKDYKIEEDPS